MTRIAIIGAGVSGLAAAEKLATFQDVQVVLFEGRDRIGGRAFTDTTLTARDGGPIPFGWGCHWIHGVADNPLSRISDSVFSSSKNCGYRFSCIEDEEGAAIFNAGQHDTEASGDLDLLAFKLFTRLQGGIVQDDRYVTGNLTLSASELLRHTDPEVFENPLFPLASWFRLTMEQSSAPHDFLAADYIRAEAEDIETHLGPRVEGANGLVPLGLGALIHAWGQQLLDTKKAQLELRLDAKVETVRRTDSSQYELTWRQGGGAPRPSEPFDAVLVTVPTEVIRQKHLQFEPPLPQELSEAFTQLPMGNFKKVALQFPPGTLSHFVHEGRRYVTTAEGGAEMPVFIGLIERDDLAVMMAFDRWASHYDDLTPMEVAKAAVGFLRTMVGDAVSEAKLVAYSMTNWRKDRFSLGAYAYTQVGEGTFTARTRLIHHMRGNTLVFAGEAITELGAGGAHGAWWSGDTAAAELAKTLGLSGSTNIIFQKPTTSAPPPGPQRITLSPGSPPTRIIIRTGE